MRAFALVLAACAADAATGLPDGGTLDPDAPPGCNRPVDPPPWLAGLVDDAIGHLSMTDRATVSNRAATRAWLTEQLTAYGYTPEAQAYATGTNVYARLPSTTGDDGWIVVGAHFDTVPSSPGANDNATGIAAALAVARQVRAMPCRGPGVIVAFFDQEEIGIVGSTQFAGMLFQTGTPVVSVHTIDQVGWDSDGDRAYELEMPTAALETAYEATAARLGARVTTTGTTTSDHQAFRERGFPATGITEEYVGGDTTPYIHSPNDRYDTVDLAYAALAARLVAETVMDELEP